MNYTELRKRLMAFYENKLTSGELMAIDNIFSVKTATEQELVHIYKIHLLSIYTN